jgi:Flp pilus assembly pilin Flp
MDKGLKEFWENECASVSTEYVVLIAAAGALLVAGVGALYYALGDLFAAWATYFKGG